MARAVPALAGKMDMFPGRVTRLALQPDKPGTYRGQCAEFCGTSHALMAFQVVAVAPGDFERWLAEQATPAKELDDAMAVEGKRAFLSADRFNQFFTMHGSAMMFLFAVPLFEAISILILLGMLGDRHYQQACAACHGVPDGRQSLTLLSMLPPPPPIQNELASYYASPPQNQKTAIPSAAALSPDDNALAASMERGRLLATGGAVPVLDDTSPPTGADVPACNACHGP